MLPLLFYSFFLMSTAVSIRSGNHATLARRPLVAPTPAQTTPHYSQSTQAKRRQVSPAPKNGTTITSTSITLPPASIEIEGYMYQSFPDWACGFEDEDGGIFYVASSY
jgi:hypothetical protein